MYTVAISTEIEKVYYQSKFGGNNVLEPVRYVIINGLKVRAGEVIRALCNEKLFSFPEEKKLLNKPSDKKLLEMISPFTNDIVTLLRLSF